MDNINLYACPNVGGLSWLSLFSSHFFQLNDQMSVDSFLTALKAESPDDKFNRLMEKSTLNEADMNAYRTSRQDWDSRRRNRRHAEEALTTSLRQARERLQSKIASSEEREPAQAALPLWSEHTDGPSGIC